MSDLEMLNQDEWAKIHVIAGDISEIMKAHNVDNPALRVSALCLVLGVEIEAAPAAFQVYMQNMIVDLIDLARRYAAGDCNDRSERAVVLRAKASEQ